MELEDLKQNLGALTLNDLEELGLVDENHWNDDVLMLTTSEENDKTHNESTWVASINTDDRQLIIITNGMLVSDSEKPEVGRVYVNEEKAEMLLEALRHAFPEILRSYIRPKKPFKLRKKRFDKKSRLLDLPSLEGITSISSAIKSLRKTIREFRRLRRKGYEFNSRVSNNMVSVKAKRLSSNKLIDVHQALKRQLSKLLGNDVQISSIPGKKTTTYIAAAPNSQKIWMTQVDVKNLAADNSLRDVRMTEITPDIGKALLKQLQTAFGKHEE